MENSDQIWLIIILVAAVFFFLGRAMRGGESAEDREARQMREAQKAEELFAGLSAESQNDVDALLRDGKIIAAVKQIREETGAGLREAKLATDARRRRLG